MKLADIKLNGNSISLVKLSGSEIADVALAVTNSYGDPCLHVYYILLKDGRSYGLQGEHDAVYLEDYGADKLLTTKELYAIYLEENGKWMDDNEKAIYQEIVNEDDE